MNDCGADVETVHVYYDHCVIPNINIENTNLNVNVSYYTFEAMINNMPTENGISLLLNGQNTNFSFMNGMLTSHVTLQPGENVFSIGR